MTDILLPTIITEYPTRAYVASIPGIRMLGIAVKIARNIHMRCRLAEAQNWKCCWCGEVCRAEPDHKDSATIEHVQPRSLGGADAWENYAMACASCNHRRGTLSIEDFIAGRFPVKRPSKTAHRRSKSIEKYIKKALHRNEHGWIKKDGSKLCKQEWFDSLNLHQEAYRERLQEILFGEAA